MTEETIASVDPLIAASHFEWTRNRHVIDGSRSIRPNSTLYLPMVAGQSPRDYQNYVARVPFFPAAARTLEGLQGLLFRKAATITAPAGVTDILNTITAQGFTLDDLAEEVASELLITNYLGLVVDYPPAPAGLTKAQAIAQGFRPFVAIYRAESILGVPELAVINNRQRVVRVRLLDDVNTVRELRLDAGIYSITMHRKSEGGWVADEPIVPTRKGKPLDEIPFTLVSTKRSFVPHKAPLHDICAMNIEHYLASANLATMDYYSTVAVFTIAGSKGIPKDFPVYAGAMWIFEHDTVKTEILEPSGATIDGLRKTVSDIENRMAAVGSRILASEKPAAEAADTLAIRRASENATLAAIGRLVSRKITDALKWVAWWLELPEDSLRYEINTDFNALALTSTDITARQAMWQSGAISLDAYLDMMIEHEVLPESFDKEADQQKVKEQIDAAPPAL